VASKNWNYWYDGFNQLSRVQNPDGQFTDYTYNGNGLRTKKDFGDKATNYYYNGGNIILETDKDNAVTAKNVRGLRLIYRESYANGTDPTYLYYLHNAHGDVTQLLNEKGQVVKDYRYDTFGKEEMPESKVFGGKQTTELWRQEVEKIDNPFRYCGEYLDEETGNYYLRARYYDPSTQRFINEDSFGVALGAGWVRNLFNYASNNPLRFVDPNGHAPVNVKVGNVTVGNAQISNGRTTGNLTDIVKGLGYSDPKYNLGTNSTTAVINGKTITYNLNNLKNGVGTASNGSKFTVVNGRIQVGVRDLATVAGISSSKINVKSTSGSTQVSVVVPMKASDKLIGFLTSYESFSATPYRGADSQNLTIGYGHVIKPGEKLNNLTVAQGRVLLKKDLQSRVDAVNNALGTQVSQQQFDALVDLTYNIGAGGFKGSSLLKDINKGNATDAVLKADFLKWTYCNGERLEGLWRRRVNEWDMWDSADYTRDYPKMPR